MSNTQETAKTLTGVSRETLSTDAPQLVALQDNLPNLTIITSSSDIFNTTKAVFQFDLPPDHIPLAIVRPKSAEDVSAIIRFTVSSIPRIPITVRAGGHDLWGRSSAKGSLVLDLREMNSVTISPDRKSAAIGGGTISIDLLKSLDSHGLVAATGVCPTVGSCNWAMVGGYGMLAGAYGLGVDQIIEATIVDAKGDIRAADEETLWGVRGGGGNFGVVVELKIKVFDLPKMLGGFVVFPWAEATQVLTNYQTLLETDYPDAFSGNAGAGNLPGLGLGLAIVFGWASPDLEAGQKYLEKIKGLGTVLISTVQETKLATFLESAFPVVPEHVNPTSVYVPGFSEEFINILVEHTNRITPDTDSFVNIHASHGEGTKSNENSCFRERRPHLMVEILGATKNSDAKQEPFKWADDLESALLESGLVMTGGYLNLLRPTASVKDSYGENWEKLLALKKKLDPENVFCYACPSLAQ